MRSAIITIGSFAAAMAIADLIHGPHNGDRHRFYIHVLELIAFLVFLGLLKIKAFSWFHQKYKFNRWLSATIFSAITAVVGFILFALSGGSFHGDGGPISFSFLTYSMLASLVFPVTFIGFLVLAIIRFRSHSSIIDK